MTFEAAASNADVAWITLAGTLGGVVVTAAFGVFTAFSHNSGSTGVASRSTASRQSENCALCAGIAMFAMSCPRRTFSIDRTTSI